MTYVDLGATGGGLSDYFARYGADTARGMVAIISQLPPSERAAAMKAAMAKIDPGLQARAERYAIAWQKAGLAPSAALERGIAQGVEEGFVDELAKLGASRRMPARGSLLGLGIYGSQDSLGSALTDIAASFGVKVTAASTFTTPSSKKFMRVGPFYFPIDNHDVYGQSIKSPGQIPAEWKPAIKKALLRGAGESGPEKPWTYAWADWTNTSPTNFILRKEGEPDWKNQICQYLEAFGIKCSRYALPVVRPDGRPVAGPLISKGQAIGGEMFAPWPGKDLTWQQMRGEGGQDLVAPILKFKHPSTGADWGVFFSFKPHGLPRNPLPTDPYGEVVLYFARIPGKPWYHKVWAAMSYIPSKIEDKIVDAAGAIHESVKWVGDQTCKVLSNVAGGVPAPPTPQGQMVAGGIALANQMCGNVPPPMPIMPPPSSGLLPLLLIGGGVLAAVALTRDRE